MFKKLIGAALCALCLVSLAQKPSDMQKDSVECERVALADDAHALVDGSRWPDEVVARSRPTQRVTEHRNLASNQAFWMTRTASPTGGAAAPEVLRGRAVSLRVQSGGVMLERTGVALENGRLGQLARVRLQGVSAPLIGKVTGIGRLEVQL